jgi:hypothetical protein
MFSGVTQKEDVGSKILRGRIGSARPPPAVPLQSQSSLSPSHQVVPISMSQLPRMLSVEGAGKGAKHAIG